MEVSEGRSYSGETTIDNFVSRMISNANFSNKLQVTGTCNEIGRELCLRFGKLEKCCSIICWDSDKANTLLADQLRTLGVKKVAAFKVDLGDREQIKAAAAKVKQSPACKIKSLS